MNRIAKAVAAAGLTCTALVAQAELFDRGGGMIYDSSLDVTWLQDMNYANATGYAVDGRMSWQAAMTWAADLEHGGYADWRLPSALNRDGSGPCYGFSCTQAELPHLYEITLGIGRNDWPRQIAPFINTGDIHYFYWSSTEDLANPGWAWAFTTVQLSQISAPGDRNLFLAIALREGDVRPIPEPASWLLLVAGLGIVLARSHRARHNQLQRSPRRATADAMQLLHTEA